MSKHFYFNMQALPHNEKKSGFIGKSGYASLFQYIKELNKNRRKNNALQDAAYPLRNDYFFTLDTVHFDPLGKDDFAYGKLIKFDRVENVKSLNTEQVQFEGQKDSISKIFSFDYVFDCKKHILAIADNNQKLPSPLEVEKALEYIFGPIISHLFPDYSFNVNIMTSSASLEEVLETANSYNTVRVEVTFSNSDSMIDAYLKDTENELRENGITKLVHQEGAGSNSFSSPTKQCIAYLRLATKFGNAHIRYITNELEKKIYKMRDFPVFRSIVKRKSEEQYNEEVLRSMNEVDAETKVRE